MSKINDLTLLQQQTNELEQSYLQELENNPAYSLQVNAEGKYDMTNEQIEFVKWFVEYKSIGTAAELAGIDMDTAKAYYLSYASQQEIRRINKAMYHRQFKEKLLSLNDIAGYLSSLITDNNVAIADRLKTSDKLKVIQMLIDLNKLKLEALHNPSVVMVQNIEQQLKSLSVETIKQMLSVKDTSQLQQKHEIIDKLDTDSTFTPEEEAYLSTLPTEDLLQLIESQHAKGGDDK